MVTGNSYFHFYRFVIRVATCKLLQRCDYSEIQKLLLRIEAVLRRSTGLKPEDEQEIFKIGKLTFNSKKQTLFDGEEEQKLNDKRV